MAIGFIYKRVQVRRSLPIILISFAKLTLAQVPDIQWEISLGGSNWEEAHSVQQTFDHGFIVAGWSPSIDGNVTGNHGLTDGWLVKLDSLGTVEWEKSIGGSLGDYFYSVEQTPDSGYIAAGVSGSSDGDVSLNHGAFDSWVVKTDANGNIIWEHSYGGSQSDYANSLSGTSDGGYILAGTSYSNDFDVSGHHGNSAHGDYWVIKINSIGEMEWQSSLGGSDEDESFSAIEIQNESIIVSGFSRSIDGDVEFNHGNLDYWIVNLSKFGNIIWQKSYGGSLEDKSNSILQTYDNKLILSGGSAYSNDGDIIGHHGITLNADNWQLKIDSTSDLYWEKPFGGSGGDCSSQVFIDLDNNIIACGYTASNDGDVSGHHGAVGSNWDFWIFKYDTVGALIWQKCLGGTGDDRAYSLQSTSDGGYIVAGLSNSTNGDVTGNHGSYDYWVVKLSTPCDHVLFYSDADGDGYGDLDIDSLSCLAPVGFVSDSLDCNDADAAIFPAAIDICNAQDDNCNGLIDEDADFIHWFADADADGFGDAGIDSVSCFSIPGFVMDATDCNDANALINPGIAEICNAVDDNCSGTTDEGLLFQDFYADTDADGFGDAAAFIHSCLTEISGYVLNSTDCNDADNTVFPGAAEICNAADDNCNGIADEGLPTHILFADADGDAFGNAAIDSITCQTGMAGFVSDSTDCDDNNALIYPGAPEILNGADDNCNQLIDEGLNVSDGNENAFSIYPNPITQTLVINTVAPINNPEMRIFNLAGQKVFEKKVYATATAFTLSNLNLPAGNYYLQIISTASVMTAKFEVVQ